MAPDADAGALEEGTKIAEESPLDSNEKDTPKVHSERNKWYALGIFVLCCALFSIILPTTLVLSKTSGVEVNPEVDPEDDNSDSDTGPSFLLIEGPFRANLTLFNEGIVEEPYADPAPLQEDLENAVRFLLNIVVKRNTNVTGFENVGFGGRNPNSFVDFVETDVELDATNTADAAFQPVTAATESAKGPTVGSTVNDFGTNNQEKDVEEGDLIVSDGERVYAAYGDYILVLNARSDEVLAKVQMPPVNKTTDYPIETPFVGFNVTVDEPAEATTEKDLGGGRRRESSIYPRYYNPRPNIRSLALHEGRLLAIVEGYGYAQTPPTQRSYSILYDYRATNIRVYNTTIVATDEEAGTLPFKGEVNVNGRFNAVRIVDGSAHVVTTTGIDTYTALVKPFERYNFDRKLTDAKYIEAVQSLAEKENYVEQWAADLIAELKFDDGKMPKLARISIFQNDVSDTGVIEQITSGEGVVNNIAQVFSFDLSADTNFAESKVAGVTASGSFLPTSWGEVYASTNALIFAGQGWNYNPVTRTSKETTYLIGLAITGDVTDVTSIGLVDGYLLNSYSIDVVGSILRIATSLRRRWRALPVRTVAFEDGTTTEAAEAVEEIDESSTENNIIIMEMPGLDGEKPGTMVERGRVRLGKPDELFTTVRFFDKIAYAATFERKDPFYVLDLSNITNPEALGELSITGFSSYLYPMNADNTLLLAVGEDADEDGNILGLSITVFDARDPANPFAIQRYSIEDDPDAYSASQGQWNFKALRYIREVDRLIMPVSIYNYQQPKKNFAGSMVFVVNADTIYEDCRIPDRNYQQGGYIDGDVFITPVKGFYDTCVYCASLPRRSLVFDGNLTTLYSHFVTSTNMDSCEPLWSLDINDDGSCCY